MTRITRIQLVWIFMVLMGTVLAVQPAHALPYYESPDGFTLSLNSNLTGLAGATVTADLTMGVPANELLFAADFSLHYDSSTLALTGITGGTGLGAGYLAVNYPDISTNLPYSIIFHNETLDTTSQTPSLNPVLFSLVPFPELAGGGPDGTSYVIASLKFTILQDRIREQSPAVPYFSGIDPADPAFTDPNFYHYPAPVPEPATMLLLGSGLAALAGRRAVCRRKI